MLLTWGYTKSFRMCLLNFGIYCMPYYISSLVLIQFTTVVLLVWERLTALNQWLTKLVVNRDYTNDNQYSQLRRISILYNKLFRISSTINTIYSEQVSLTFWLVGMQAVHCAHSFVKRSELLRYYDIFWVSIAFIEICTVVVPCSAIIRLVK